MQWLCLDRSSSKQIRDEMTVVKILALWGMASIVFAIMCSLILIRNRG